MKKEVSVSLGRGITEKMLGKWEAQKINPVVRNAILKNGIQDTALNNSSLIDMHQAFSIDLKTGDATSQNRSGRCWLFAGLNVFRYEIMQRYNLKNFELSQAYPMFWDKLEKSNYFLENVLDTLDEGTYSRVFMWLLRAPVQDGGQWDMFANLIDKYGVVPKYAMPETYHSSNTGQMNFLLTLKLRDNARILREMYREGKADLSDKKDEMMAEIYKMLVYFLGEPPKVFDIEWRDKDEEFHSERGLTPRAFFAKYVDINLDDYVSIINAPTCDKPFDNTYTVKYLGNVTEGKPVLYLNVEGQELRELALRQLKDNKPVWFGCDVGKWLERNNGIMDTRIYLYEEALEIEFGLDKAARLDYGVSQLTHAMVFTGVNIVDGKPTKWKVENSWGDKVGEKGYFVMSDNWFDQYNYQIVVHKKYLSDKHIEALKKQPQILPPWDPMGSLAISV